MSSTARPHRTLRKVLAHVGDTQEHTLTDPLTGVPLVAMYAGAAAYVLANVAFRLRNVGTLGGHRLVAAVDLLVLLPVAWRLPALAALALLAAVLAAVVLLSAAEQATRTRRGP